MKIVNTNGRLETQGTWEETDAQAKRQADGIVQQRTELRAMLSGNVAFHVDPRAAKPVKRVRLCLTDEAEAEYASFYHEYGDGNCSCHISAPCGSCTHPGNPLNQAEDDTAWVVGEDPHAAPKPDLTWALDLAEKGGDLTAYFQQEWFNRTDKPAAPAKAAVKPPAVWRTADQIPQSERHGLWFHRSEGFKDVGRSFNAKEIDSDGLYLKAAPNVVAAWAKYNPDDYQQPDADGWFAHDPQPDSVCPVPAEVEFEVRHRGGPHIKELPQQDYRHHSWWPIGAAGNRNASDCDIVAWRPVRVAA